uniref:NADH-ubiquinone oxidoreductase chain 4L n=1 Tax=Amorophaga japonica TaxID=1454529 RepID=A0A6M6D1T0_9NEOP|nr:NADH dehydrogenase subunit 4L [Amorophaga japonica]
MMIYFNMIFIIMFLIGNMIFVSKYKHLLITLLSLEFMVLMIFSFFLFFFMNIDYSFYFIMMFLVFSVCEGVLGLSILILMIRSYGNDYFQSFILL